MLAHKHATRPRFSDGDAVMLCSHVFERAKITLSIDWPNVTWKRETVRFVREDGTSGRGDYWVMCPQCIASDPKQVDFVEEVSQHGVLHVADFMRRPKW